MWKGDYPTGIYQSVFRIVAITLIIPDIIVNIMLPGLMYLHKKDEAKWKIVGHVASKTLFYLGLLIGLFFFEFADLVIAIAYGSDQYAAAVPVLRIFGLIIFVRYAGEVPALMLTTSHRQSLRMSFVVVATLLNLLMNGFAIPEYGVIGAAWVSLITNGGLLLAYNISMRHKFADAWLSPARLSTLLVAILGGFLLESLSQWSKWSVMIIVVIVIAAIVRRFGYSAEEQRQMVNVEFGVPANET